MYSSLFQPNHIDDYFVNVRKKMVGARQVVRDKRWIAQNRKGFFRSHSCLGG
jgi:hypothetical protein